MRYRSSEAAGIAACCSVERLFPQHLLWSAVRDRLGVLGFVQGWWSGKEKKKNTPVAFDQNVLEVWLCAPRIFTWRLELGPWGAGCDFLPLWSLEKQFALSAFLGLQEEAEDRCFPPSFECSVYLGGFSDLSPLSIAVKTSRGAGVRVVMCNVGIVILLLCGGSIRQMFNIWNSTLHDSHGDSNCCHLHRTQAS